MEGVIKYPTVRFSISLGFYVVLWMLDLFITETLKLSLCFG